MHEHHCAQTQKTLQHLGAVTLPQFSTGPLFDFHQVYANHQREPLNREINHADVPISLRKPLSKDDAMPLVDSHGMGRCKEWPAVDHRPHAPKVLLTARNVPRREPLSGFDARSNGDIMLMSRKERILFLENMDKVEIVATKNCEDQTGCSGQQVRKGGENSARQDNFLEQVTEKSYRGPWLTSRRANRELVASGREALGKSARDNAQETNETKAPRAWQRNLKAAQANEGYEIDDGFMDSVQTKRAALRNQGALSQPVPERIAPDSSFSSPAVPSSPGRRQYPKRSPASPSSTGRQQHPRSALESKAPGQSAASQQEPKPDVEQMTSWLAELASAASEDKRDQVLQSSSIEQGALFVRVSSSLKRWAYILRPNDAIEAVKLLAKSASLLESYERAAGNTQFDDAALKAGVAHEDALISVRSAIEAILAAVAMRITSAEAPYVADVLLAMAETRTGRQEYMDAALGHMLWLLAAKPRTFQPQVIARIFWALGSIKVGGGAEGEKLSVASKDANRRAVDALQARLVEVLDDFLEDDIGTLALDPTCGSLLGDMELRRVLHRAGRLQVGLWPESMKYLPAMKNLEASARARLWEPYQAEIMPFMRDYCEDLVAAQPQ